MKRFILTGVVFGLTFAGNVNAAPCPPTGAIATHHGPLSGEVRPEALPPALESGGLRYMTGGIGVDAAEAMRAVRQRYALAVTFVLMECGGSQFAANVNVRIEEADGNSIFEIRTGGPYLFVDLPPGNYRIVASSELGAPRQRDFRVNRGNRTELLISWESD